MKKIPLSQGKVALVDDSEFDSLSKHKWAILRTKRTCYAQRKIWIDPSARRTMTILMHREILGLWFGDKRECDHRDTNGLNNQKNNLRICSSGQNKGNQRAQSKKKYSKFKGVTFKLTYHTRPWMAQIQIARKHRTIGYFYTPEAAALAYNFAAQRHFGEFARLNEVR